MIEQIGNFEIDLSSAKTNDGNLNTDMCSEIYKNVAINICTKEESPSKEFRKEYFNFFCNVSGLKGVEIAKYMRVDRGQVSQWRRVGNKKEIGDLAWNYIRLFFYHFFISGYKVTNPIFLDVPQAVQA